MFLCRYGELDINKGYDVLLKLHDVGKKAIESESIEMSAVAFTILNALKYPNHVFNIVGYYEYYQSRCLSQMSLQDFMKEFADSGSKYFDSLLQCFREKNSDNPELVEEVEEEISVLSSL